MSVGDKTTGVEALSDRQKQILRLVAQHLQAKEVARILKISKHTVDTHTEEARKRLNVATSREAARILVAHEAESGLLYGLPNEYRPLPIGIPEAPGTVPQSGHGHAHRPESSPEVIRQAVADQDYAEHRSGPRPDSLADGIWARFRRGLKDLSTLQWIGTILAVAVLSAFLMGGLITALLGILEILQQITQFAGWRT